VIDLARSEQTTNLPPALFSSMQRCAAMIQIVRPLEANLQGGRRATFASSAQGTRAVRRRSYHNGCPRIFEEIHTVEIKAWEGPYFRRLIGQCFPKG
jgi:hypothetical protein